MLKYREINHTQKFSVFGALVEENWLFFSFFKLVYLISLIPDWNCPFDCDYAWDFLTLGGKDHKMDKEHPGNEELSVNSLFLSTCLVWIMRKGQMEQHGCCYLLCWWVALAVKNNVLFLVLHYVFQFLWIYLQIRQIALNLLGLPWYGHLSPESQVALGK